jgi:hypothetical protein
MVLRKLNGSYAIVRLPADSRIPDWCDGSFLSVTRTLDELSIVAAADLIPPGFRVEAGWSLLMVEGPLEFSEVGVLASLAVPLASSAVSILAISTFDTDYLLVRETDAERACEALAGAGHEITGDPV